MIGRSAADPTANSVATLVRPDGSSLGTRTSSRRPTAAPAARTRSRFGLRSAKTTRSTSSRRVAPSARTTAEATRSRPPTETSASAGIGPMTRSHRHAPAPRRRLRSRARSRPAAPVARPDPEPVHQADDGPRRHDPRPVRTRHERNALVRAGRRHDRAGPDLEMRVRGDRGRPSRRTSRSPRRRSGSRPRPPRRPRPARRASDRWPEPAPRIPCQPAPIPGSASMTVDAAPASAAPSAARSPARPPPTTRTSVSIRRLGRPARAGAAAHHRQPTAPPEPAQHIEIALAQPARSQEPVVVEGRRDPARQRARPATAGRARRMARRARRARPGPRAPGRGTSGRSARRRPRTRTSRTGRSST